MATSAGSVIRTDIRSSPVLTDATSTGTISIKRAACSRPPAWSAISMPISVVCLAMNARLGGTNPVVRRVRSTPRLLLSALSSPTIRAMSGVMCSMIPMCSSISLIVGPL